MFGCGTVDEWIVSVIKAMYEDQALSQEFFSGCPNFFRRGESARLRASTRLRASAPKNQLQHDLHKNGAIVIVAYILMIDV